MLSCLQSTGVVISTTVVVISTTVIVLPNYTHIYIYTYDRQCRCDDNVEG